MKVLFPHMFMEERYAVPPLKLLPLLARGEVTPDMRSILPKVDRLYPAAILVSEYVRLRLGQESAAGAPSEAGNNGFASSGSLLETSG